MSYFLVVGGHATLLLEMGAGGGRGNSETLTEIEGAVESEVSGQSWHYL